MNTEALLKMHRKIQTRGGGLDLNVVDRSIFIFYFEEVSDMEFVLRKAPWSFDNSLMVLHR